MPRGEGGGGGGGGVEEAFPLRSKCYTIEIVHLMSQDDAMPGLDPGI